MIRTIKIGHGVNVEFDGLTSELVYDYSAILKGLLADEEMKRLILAVTLEIIEREAVKDQKELEELLKEMDNKNND